MIVIGHKGAAGLAPENTLESIDQAIKAGVDKIEIDVRFTRDGRAVIFHDSTLYRITGESIRICDLSLKQINTTITKSGHPIPTLQEALDHAGKIPVMIDCKSKNWAQALASELKNQKKTNFSVISTQADELYEFKRLMPKVETYISELTKPMSAVYEAINLKFTGVSLYFWILNPLSYLYAKRAGLKIVVYTVNRPILAKFLHFFYPGAEIVTDSPDKLAKLSKRRTKK